MNFNLENEEQSAIPATVIIRCPVCKSENIADISTYQSNGIYGHGSRSWKTSDMRSCKDCGVIFKPVKGNGL
jgi:predicted Zn-ribbon and HTH transcriptional regulator